MKLKNIYRIGIIILVLWVYSLTPADAETEWEYDEFGHLILYYSYSVSVYNGGRYEYESTYRWTYTYGAGNTILNTVCNYEGSRKKNGVLTYTYTGEYAYNKDYRLTTTRKIYYASDGKTITSESSNREYYSYKYNYGYSNSIYTYYNSNGTRTVRSYNNGWGQGYSYNSNITTEYDVRGNIISSIYSSRSTYDGTTYEYSSTAHYNYVYDGNSVVSRTANYEGSQKKNGVLQYVYEGGYSRDKDNYNTWYKYNYYNKATQIYRTLTYEYGYNYNTGEYTYNTSTIDYEYYASGNLKTKIVSDSADPQSRTIYSYYDEDFYGNGVGRLCQELFFPGTVQGMKRIDYQYWEGTDTVKIKEVYEYPLGYVATYEYDENSRLTKIMWANRLIEHYDEYGSLSSITLPNGLEIDFRPHEQYPPTIEYYESGNIKMITAGVDYVSHVVPNRYYRYYFMDEPFYETSKGLIGRIIREGLEGEWWPGVTGVPDPYYYTYDYWSMTGTLKAKKIYNIGYIPRQTPDGSETVVWHLSEKIEYSEDGINIRKTTYAYHSNRYLKSKVLLTADENDNIKYEYRNEAFYGEFEEEGLGMPYGRLWKVTKEDGSYELFVEYWEGTDQVKVKEAYDSEDKLVKTYRYDEEGNRIFTADDINIPKSEWYFAFSSPNDIATISSTADGVYINFSYGYFVWYADAGFTYDNPDTPDINESIDLSDLSELIIGLRGLVLGDDLSLTVSDADGNSASVELLDLDNDSEKIYAISTSSLEGIDLTRVQSVTFSLGYAYRVFGYIWVHTLPAIPIPSANDILKEPLYSTQEELNGRLEILNQLNGAKTVPEDANFSYSSNMGGTDKARVNTPQ